MVPCVYRLHVVDPRDRSRFMWKPGVNGYAHDKLGIEEIGQTNDLSYIIGCLDGGARRMFTGHWQRIHVLVEGRPERSDEGRFEPHLLRVSFVRIGRRRSTRLRAWQIALTEYYLVTGYLPMNNLRDTRYLLWNVIALREALG